jgi:hypothetical protein
MKWKPPCWCCLSPQPGLEKIRRTNERARSFAAIAAIGLAIFLQVSRSENAEAEKQSSFYFDLEIHARDME